MSVIASNIDLSIDKFIDENVRCQTCKHAIKEDLFNCYCEHPEGSAMAQGWNSKTTCCECHDFKDETKNAELQALMDRRYNLWAEENPEFANITE